MQNEIRENNQKIFEQMRKIYTYFATTEHFSLTANFFDNCQNIIFLNALMVQQ